MKEYVPKEGELVPIFEGVLDRQQLRVECGSFPEICNLSVPAISTGEGDIPRHRLCIYGDGDVRPWCGHNNSAINARCFNDVMSRRFISRRITGKQRAGTG